jgi:hypothetical protein
MILRALRGEIGWLSALDKVRCANASVFIALPKIWRFLKNMLSTFCNFLQM